MEPKIFDRSNIESADELIKQLEEGGELMSWLLNLYDTYQSNLDRVGEIEKKYNGQEYTLLPISHTTQSAHIEVLITEEGEFHSPQKLLIKTTPIH